MPTRFIKFFSGYGAIMERITDFFAVFGLLSWLNPAVYDWLSGISSFAALMMPVLGCIWLAVQIWSRVVVGK